MLRATDVNDPAPPPVTTGVDQQAAAMTVGYKRRRTDGKGDPILCLLCFLNLMIDDIDLRVIRTCAPPTMSHQEVFDLLLRMDSVVKPGITAVELQDLLAKCGACGIIATRRVFRSHECVMEVEKAAIIDLTGDDDA